MAIGGVGDSWDIGKDGQVERPAGPTKAPGES
jgi:hypothetical protein